MCFTERGDGPRSGGMWCANDDPVLPVNTEWCLLALLVPFLPNLLPLTIPSGDSQDGRQAGQRRGEMKSVNPHYLSANKELPLPAIPFYCLSTLIHQKKALEPQAKNCF